MYITYYSAGYANAYDMRFHFLQATTSTARHATCKPVRLSVCVCISLLSAYRQLQWSAWKTHHHSMELLLTARTPSQHAIHSTESTLNHLTISRQKITISGSQWIRACAMILGHRCDFASQQRLLAEYIQKTSIAAVHKMSQYCSFSTGQGLWAFFYSTWLSSEFLPINKLSLSWHFYRLRMQWHCLTALYYM